MTIKTRNEITEKDMIEAMKIGIPKIYTLLCNFLGMLCIISGVVGLAVGKTISGIIGIILAIVVLLWRYKFMPERTGKKQYAIKKDMIGGKDMVQNLNFFNNHAELISSNSQMVKLKYSDIKMVKETKDIFFIIFGRNVVMMVKKNGFVEGTLEDLKERIAPYINK